MKCETPVDPYSFVDEEMSMSGRTRTASSPGDNPDMMTCPGGASGLGTPTCKSPGPMMAQQLHQQHHQMSMAMNGMLNPLAIPHQPKKRGRKKKSEMILTPEESVH